MMKMSVYDAKQILHETASIYLEKNEDGDYVMPQNKQRPIILIGPAGIGKTECVRQAAKECGLGFVSYSLTHHTRQSAVGLPAIVTKHMHDLRAYNDEKADSGWKEKDGEDIGFAYQATEYTMSEIVEAVYESIRHGHREGILFVDEINCVSETLSAVMLQFLQEKSFGTHRIPEGWIIVGAGNPSEYNKSVHEFDAVTCDRLRIIHLEANLDIWMEYAQEIRIHPVIQSFLNGHAQMFYCIDRKGREQYIVTPRGWEDLSNALRAYERKHYEVSIGLIGQFIQHEPTAQQFFDYYSFVHEVLSGEEMEQIYQGGDISALLEKIKNRDFIDGWMVTGQFGERLSNDAMPIAGKIRDLREAHQPFGEEIREQIDRWHVMLDRCLGFIEQAFGIHEEMNYLISWLCRNRDTGYLLAMKKNERYLELGKQMNGDTGALDALRKEIKAAVAE